MSEPQKTFPMRSLLFAPSNNWRFLLNAIKSDADIIVADLEDGVPVGDKETGRWLLKEFLEKERWKTSKKVFVRINGIASGMYKEDLEFAVRKGLDGIVLPKTDGPEDVREIERILEKLEKERGLPVGHTMIIPLIETAKGVERAYEIAVSSKRIVALSFGAGDYLRDLGLDYTHISPDQVELVYPRSRVVVAAVAAGLQAIDTPYLGLIIDYENVRKEASIAKRLGYKGKYAIHPAHIPIYHQVFTPSPQEIEEAKGIVQAYEEAARKGLGATTYKGRMIDYMSYNQARKLLEMAKMMGVA